MEKRSLLIALVLVMALALAAPAFAGLSTDINGFVETQLRYDQQDKFTAWGDFEAKLGISAGSDGDLKVAIGLADVKAEDNGLFGSNPFADSDNINLAVDWAYVEANGAWIEGTPPVRSRLGSLTASYSDWVADISHDGNGRTDSVEISGLNLGPVSLTTFYGWLENGVSGEGTLAAVSADTSVDVLDLGFDYITEKTDAGDEVSSDYALEASASPAEGVEVSAVYASHGASGTAAYEVNGEIAATSNLTVSGSVWSAADGFQPEWAEYHKDNHGETHSPNGVAVDRTTAFTTNQKGFEVNASTTQAGLPIEVGYKSSTDAAGTEGSATSTISASTTVAETDLSLSLTSKAFGNDKTVVSAKRSFGDINAGYTFTQEETVEDKHEITADTTVDTPIANGVKLASKVILQGNDTNYGFDATWSAPNGFNLGVGYANYDRDDDWPGGYRVTDDADGADGLSVHAGVKVNF